MENKRKFFSRELFVENDLKARKAFREIVEKEQLPFVVVDNPKKLGVDLLLYNNDIHVLNVELEIKKVWKTPEFIYPDVNVLFRKKKYFDPELTEVPAVLVMFSENVEQFMVIKGQDILASEVVEVNNKYVFKGEYFFKVPITKVVFNSLEGLNECIKEK